MDCLLGESLEISTVMDAKIQYAEWLKQSSLLRVNASQVSKVDTAGVQLLASLFVSAKQLNVAIELSESSAVLTEAFVTLGLTSVFNDETDG
ncbi:STAS domain-containing protein [Vibrio genomosp. F10]|uniref:Anti-anti-sigma factor n=1 Tax=Vibrio genomosp. F10 str. ZF-129 TaxID=1187848 RepID=A0A1E5B9W1_9VIBR|nr:STAS domain-containing protein [Vibrio genomosp. F10]OEE30697.1 anti-anti-sigma factor [Vibrio genomosp. F10 str. ZF-129]OEE96764.1 anti-anti-sigma factor [Vibrio genomosp. F10 str. 9ZC157]OEF06255.1 anti-anti-sigma factor [Vibrio genomosp. F10 str. 9ZD137]OEF08443.1 anti-anti-sigma factor [Vibrio genomosp. F10 str. 9ZB36]